MKNRTFLILTALTALAVVVCIKWVDYPLATLLGHFHRHTTNMNIPDVLFPGSLLMVAVSWAVYRYCSVTKRWPSIALFSRTIGILIPIVYIVKEMAQHLFGRIFPRAILWHHDLAEFQFFHANLLRGGFPSGHMMVAISLLLVLARFGWMRQWVLIALGSTLGVALVVTDYHFLSDVIAGAYSGFVVERFMNNYIRRPLAASGDTTRSLDA